MKFVINGNTYYTNHDRINAIYLYGSVARKENDEYSDIDILIVLDDDSMDVCELKDQNNNPVNSHWVSVYSKTALLKMNELSSLFLWHLKLEGIKIYIKDDFMDNLFENLQPYRRTAVDLLQYKMIYEDIRSCYSRSKKTRLLELSLLAGLVRNLSIMYCYLDGNMLFGRNTPVKFFLSRHNLFSFDNYKKLYIYRSLYNSKLNVSGLPDNTYILTWLEIIKNMLEIMEGKYGKS